MAFPRIVPHSDGAGVIEAAAGRDLTAAAAQSGLSIPIANVIPLAQIATAHELMESGRARGRILISLP